MHNKKLAVVRVQLGANFFLHSIVLFHLLQAQKLSLDASIDAMKIYLNTVKSKRISRE